MPADLFANNFAAQLASGIAPGDTTITLNATVPAALQTAGGQWRAIIQDSFGTEVIIVPGGQAGPTLTGVTRAAEAVNGVQAATSHSQGAFVTHVFTAGAMFGGSTASVVSVSSSDVFSRVSVSAPAIPTFADSGPWGSGCKLDGTTDDTTKAQAIVNALSTIGTNNGSPIPLMIPPGFAIALGSLTMKSYVEIRAHGATIKRASSPPNLPLFAAAHWLNSQPGVSHFSLKGGTVLGTGSETGWQGLILTAMSDNITLEDLDVKNVAVGPVYLEDSQFLWMTKVRQYSCSTIPGGINNFNFVNGSDGSTNPLKHIWCRECFVDSTSTIGFDLGMSGTPSRTDPEVDAHFVDNTSYTAGAGWPMAVEQSVGSNVAIKGIDFSGNTLAQNGTGTYGLVLDGALPSIGVKTTGVTVRGGKIVSQQTGGIGVLVGSSVVAITGVAIEAATHDILLNGQTGATIARVTVAGNTGHLGTGDQVHIGAAVDTTTVSSSNTP